ncbi:MAG: hypothetical protein IPL50_12380 [Chitinophagaceae bacterium]|nr:hypothetical protein [Chitinophagaceae bacterium]
MKHIPPVISRLPPFIRLYPQFPYNLLVYFRQVSQFWHENTTCIKSAISFSLIVPANTGHTVPGINDAGTGTKNILYYKDAPAAFAGSKISRQQLASDMQFWQTAMEESHVNPYHAISRGDMLKLQQDLLKSLPDSVTHFQASFALSTLIGALNEGHLGFASDRTSDSLFANDCIRFPYLLFDIEDGGLTVQRDLSSINKLPAFSRIIEVNGHPVQQLYTKYAAFYGGLEPWKN